MVIKADERKKQLNKRLRLLNRVVLGGVTLFVPIYIGVSLTGGSADKLENLTNLFANINNQVALTVPPDGVRYMHFFHGPPDEGQQVRAHRCALAGEFAARVGDCAQVFSAS